MITDPSFVIEQSFFELSRYPLRSSGLSTKIHTLLPLSQLDIEQRLLIYLLRSDESQSQSTFAQMSKLDISNFIQLLARTQFASMAMKQLSQVGLLNLLPEEFNAALRSLVFREISVGRTSTKCLAALLELLGPLASRVVFIKGVSLRYSIYPMPYFRSSGDFDIVVTLDSVVQIVDALQRANFYWCNVPSDCNQIGSGPSNHVSDLLLTPNPEFVPTSLISMFKEGFPQIDIKVNPVDTGMRLRKLEHFFATAEKQTVQSHDFLVPDLVYMLLIALHNLIKDRFESWKTMYDIHLLCHEITQRKLWSEFVERSQLEGLRFYCWAGLVYVSERLKCEVPVDVLIDLKPSGSMMRLFAFTSGGGFVWNSASLFTLCLGALASEDSARKFKALRSVLTPSKEFLQGYYNKRSSTFSDWLALIIIHWLVLLMPAGLTRRTIGPAIWTPEITSLDKRLNVD